jgi:starvation-inducible outer membrane lipoprotein
MNSFLKLITVGLILTALFLAACSTPPQPVGREQFQTTMNEAAEAEQTAEANQQEKRALENELARKEAELRALKDYERQLGL